MTDPAPLTDEELAASKSEVWHAIWAGRDDEIAAEAERALDRLIADLRAARAEVERLRERGEVIGRLADEWSVRAENAETKMELWSVRAENAETKVVRLLEIVNQDYAARICELQAEMERLRVIDRFADEWSVRSMDGSAP